MEPNVVRQELHRLLDHIPDSDIGTARKFLRSLLDPVALSLLNAPLTTNQRPTGSELRSKRQDANVGRGHRTKRFLESCMRVRRQAESARNLPRPV